MSGSRPWIRAVPAGLELRVKVVPGASRDALAGALGDRLKLRVAAPPEAGKANRAVCALVAGRLGVAERSVSVAAGASSPEKTLLLAGLAADAPALAALEGP
jgi:uncharacterized protein (TIGR00251 family)